MPHVIYEKEANVSPQRIANIKTPIDGENMSETLGTCNIP